MTATKKNNLKTLGNTTIHLSAIIMGCWQAGKQYWQGVSDAESIKAMQMAYDHGVTTFDTAFEYGNGHSEKLLGKALANVRDQVVIATKVFADMLSYDNVIKSCHHSLKNLASDYIDLFQIHWPAGSFGSDRVPISETMAALMTLKEQGKIKAIGVSNFSLMQLKEARQYGEIDSLQPPYSLFWRYIETESMSYCYAHNITILAYSPLAQGLLSGKYTREHRFPKDELRAKNRLCQQAVYEDVQLALDRLRPIASKNGMTLAQLALAWLIAKRGTCAIVGAKTAKQAIENAKAMDYQLSPPDLAAMDKISWLVHRQVGDNQPLWVF